MMTAFGAVGVMLFAKLLLLVSFSHDCGLVIANIEHHVSVGTLELERNLEGTVVDPNHICRLQGV
jgi:hypothetical protein